SSSRSVVCFRVNDSGLQIPHFQSNVHSSITNHHARPSKKTKRIRREHTRTEIFGRSLSRLNQSSPCQTPFASREGYNIRDELGIIASEAHPIQPTPITPAAAIAAAAVVGSTSTSVVARGGDNGCQIHHHQPLRRGCLAER